jgi:hypothetical protein
LCGSEKVWYYVRKRIPCSRQATNYDNVFGRSPSATDLLLHCVQLTFTASEHGTCMFPSMVSERRGSYKMRKNIMRQGRLTGTGLQNLFFPADSQKVRRTLTLLFAAVLFCCSAYASAQEVTLEQALDLFYKNNYDILINRYEIDKAYGDLAAAKIIPNPNISEIGRAHV